jgi:hypothetical protein
MTPVIPPGQEALLERALRPRGAGVSGFELRGFSIETSQVRARYAHEGREIPLRLLHPSTEVDGPQLEAGPFLVLLERDDDAPSCGPLMASLHRGLSSLEGRFVWRNVHDEAGEPRGDARGEPIGERVEDVQLLAVARGIKPALRMSVGLPELDAVRRHLEGAGLAVSRRQRLDDHDGVESEILCASPDADRAEALAGLERALCDVAGQSPQEDARLAARIGELLGYPACCVTAHARRVAAPVAGHTGFFEAACEAWSAEPHHRLNGIVAGWVRPLVSFEPCTFNCSAALGYADAVAAALADRDALALEVLEEALATVVVVHASGARGLATLREGEVVDVKPAPRKEGRGVDAADALALASVRGHPGARGLLGAEAVLIDFRARR